MLMSLSFTHFVEHVIRTTDVPVWVYSRVSCYAKTNHCVMIVFQLGQTVFEEIDICDTYLAQLLHADASWLLVKFDCHRTKSEGTVCDTNTIFPRSCNVMWIQTFLLLYIICKICVRKRLRYLFNCFWIVILFRHSTVILLLCCMFQLYFMLS